MKLAVVFACGFLFATGLVLGGMTQPAKVIGFLDVTGAWDPTLLFVMGGALAVYAPGYRWLMRGRPRPDFGRIDARLVGGAALFGVGWGLAGYCPGPVLTAAAAASLPALWFVAAMFAGFVLFRLVSGRRPASAAVAASPSPAP